MPSVQSLSPSQYGSWDILHKTQKKDEANVQILAKYGEYIKFASIDFAVFLLREWIVDDVSLKYLHFSKTVNKLDVLWSECG